MIWIGEIFPITAKVIAIKQIISSEFIIDCRSKNDSRERAREKRNIVNPWHYVRLIAATRYCVSDRLIIFSISISTSEKQFRSGIVTAEHDVNAINSQHTSEYMNKYGAQLDRMTVLSIACSRGATVGCFTHLCWAYNLILFVRCVCSIFAGIVLHKLN